MQLNKQRLQLWLDGKVAAYNNGSSQDIAMIKELCRQTNEGLLPIGGGLYYTCLGGRWVGGYACEKVPHQPVSWFFEPDESDPIEQRLEAVEKAVEEIRALINNKK